MKKSKYYVLSSDDLEEEIFYERRNRSITEFGQNFPEKNHNNSILITKENNKSSDEHEQTIELIYFIITLLLLTNFK